MDLRAIAEAYQNVYEKKLDPVGKEDGCLLYTSDAADE